MRQTRLINLGSGLLLAAPMVVVIAALLLMPLGVMLERSLRGVPGEAYLAILRSPSYLRAFQNTALISVISTVLALIICTPAAIFIERRKTPLRKLIAIALTIPLSLPGIVIGFFVILNFGLNGVVPQLFLSLTGERQFNFAYTFSGLLLGYLYFQIPRVVLVVRGAVASIAQDTLDAARTLGASGLGVYLNVILPTLRPALISAASLSLATAFGAYGTAATLSRGFRVVPLEIAAAFTEAFQPQTAASLSIMLAFITTVILLGLGGFATVRQPVQATPASQRSR